MGQPAGAVEVGAAVEPLGDAFLAGQRCRLLACWPNAAADDAPPPGGQPVVVRSRHPLLGRFPFPVPGPLGNFGVSIAVVDVEVSAVDQIADA